MTNKESISNISSDELLKRVKKDDIKIEMTYKLDEDEMMFILKGTQKIIEFCSENYEEQTIEQLKMLKAKITNYYDRN